METKKAFLATVNSFKQFVPVLFAVVLLISIFLTYIPADFYRKIFIGGKIANSFLGAFLGSVMAGNPATSYIIGGELQEIGVSLVAICAFLISWITVGVIQFPAESLMLGRKFALARNIVSFVFAIIAAFLIQFTLNFI